jgi:peptidoglycan/xylan/chitin deacetylase (PgdA/CDA1 family)
MFRDRARSAAARPSWVTLAILVFALVLAVASPASAAPTIVSLTFDDASADQRPFAGIMSSHGMHGTLYVPSGKVGSDSYYMTWPQVHDFAAAGNEIGGHTVHHVDLTTVSTTQARAEVCDDRQNIINQGFPAPVSFAYPLARTNAGVEQVVRDCGYSSARGVGNVGCGGCVAAETIPPPDPYLLRTTAGVTNTTSVSTIQGYVTRAETAGGGWVILVFHNLCQTSSGCNANGITQANFVALLDWLQPRAASGTVVQTVGDVMGGTPPPPSDTTPPTGVAITAPATGAQLRQGRNQVTATASDAGSGVASVRFSVDGRLIGTDTTSPYSLTWSTGGNDRGSHTLYVEAVDRAGNVTRSSTITVTVVGPQAATTTGTSQPAAVTAPSSGGGVDGSGSSTGDTPAAPRALTPTVTAAQILKILTSQLAPPAKLTRIAALLKAVRLSQSFSAPGAGRLELRWFLVPKGAHLTKATPLLVASGAHAFARAGKGTIKLRLTARGRRLLEKSKSLRLVAKGVFTPRGGKPVSSVKRFRVAR